MKFSIWDFFSECDQIHTLLRIWPHLVKKSLMENFIFCEKRLIWQVEIVQLIKYNWTQSGFTRPKWSCCFFVWQKRDFLGISCKMIFEDNITWTLPSLNFSFVDKRLKIPNLFVWTREHYCMLNYGSLKLRAFKDKLFQLENGRKIPLAITFFLLKLFLKILALGNIYVFPIWKTKNGWIWSSFGRSIPNYVVDRDAFISSFKDRFFNSTIFLS